MYKVGLKAVKAPGQKPGSDVVNYKCYQSKKHNVYIYIFREILRKNLLRIINGKDSFFIFSLFNQIDVYTFFSHVTKKKKNNKFTKDDYYFGASFVKIFSCMAWILFFFYGILVGAIEK